jgi:hypothetical protein
MTTESLLSHLSPQAQWPSGPRPMSSRLPQACRCPDCAVGVGQVHDDGCDIERCSSCGLQRLMCLLTTGGCVDHDPRAEAWSGEWPGMAECRARGWWAIRSEGRGWRSCPEGTPGAIPDLNRLAALRETGRDCLYESD